MLMGTIIAQSKLSPASSHLLHRRLKHPLFLPSHQSFIAQLISAVPSNALPANPIDNVFNLSFPLFWRIPVLGFLKQDISDLL